METNEAHYRLTAKFGERKLLNCILMNLFFFFNCRSQWYRGKDVNDEDGKSKNNMTKVNRSYNDLFRALEDTENGHQQQQQQKQMTIEDFVDEVNRN